MEGVEVLGSVSELSGLVLDVASGLFGSPTLMLRSD